MKQSTRAQMIANAFAHLLAVTSLALTFWWVGSSGDGFLGGFGYASKAERFNLHPIYMVTGMIFTFAEAILSWRTLPFSHRVNKTIHAIMQTSALTLIGLGLQATFDYTNSTNSPNLASLHSWTGIFVVSLFMANYAGGILIFANPWMDSQTKSTFLPIHQFLALFTFVLSCFQVMTGIQELNIWSGACEYDVSTVDYAPALLYYKISRGCKVSNGLGLCIFFLALTTTYAAIDLKVTQRRRGKAPESEHGGSSEKKGLFLIGSENDMREEEVL